MQAASISTHELRNRKSIAAVHSVPNTAWSITHQFATQCHFYGVIVRQALSQLPMPIDGRHMHTVNVQGTDVYVFVQGNVVRAMRPCHFAV